MRYTNPILPGFYPDPSICRRGEDFYLVTSSFEYVPGVPIFRSRNLVNWRQIGHVLTRPSQLPLDGAGISGGIFAPTLRVHGDLFYLVTTNLTRGGHFVVHAEDPAGPWSDPIWIDAEGIDPDLFWDTDGRVVFSSTGTQQEILQREFDLETGKVLSEPKRLAGFCGGKYPEAPHVYRFGGRYYLLIAEGGTEYGHCVSIARGPGPMGPWESCPHNPILTHRSTDLPIQATGHADLVEDADGNTWMVCLGIRPKGLHSFHTLGRETFLAPVSWVDGWPVVGTCGRIALEMEGHPGLPDPQPVDFATDDTFEDPELPLHWNFRCNPLPDSWACGKGSLRLRCGAADLNTMEGQSWVGRRQQHHRFQVDSAIDFTPASDAEEAGIVLFQNIHHHYEIALTRRAGSPVLVVRRTIGSLRAEEACHPVPPGPLTLRLEADPFLYRLGFLENRTDFIELGRGEPRYLSTEVGGKFTGVYIAMYATAHGQPSHNQARFTRFTYRPV